MDDGTLADRLAARTLELVDIASQSRAESALADHVRSVLDVRDLGDNCLLARPEGARILLAGHLDTVPAQANLPGRRDAGAVHGLGASDMKAGLAVAIELVRAGLPVAALFFPREELPFADSALSPLLARSPEARDFDLAIVMEPTDCTLQAGCLGNINARWVFRGVAGHSARPWLADNAIERAARAIVQLAVAAPPQRADCDGLEFVEAISVVGIEGGIARNVIPDRVIAHVNYRYAPGRTADDAERWLHGLCDGEGRELDIESNAPSAPVSIAHPLVRRLIAAGSLEVAPKQAWTPVAEFAQAGVPAVNFGPGDPAFAHRRDELVRIEALVRSFRTLETVLCG